MKSPWMCDARSPSEMRAGSRRIAQLEKRSCPVADADEMTELATLLKEQDECEPARIISLYEEAIRRSAPVAAKVNLAIILADGWGLPRDIARSDSLLKNLITEDGWADQVLSAGWSDALSEAIYRLALLYEMSKDDDVKDFSRAAELYRRICELGDKHCKVNCARARYANLLMQGAGGIQKDIARAVALLTEATNSADTAMDDSVAKLRLASVLETGAEGVERDERRAAALYESLIQAGENEGALVRLGLMYQCGFEGQRADGNRARQLFRQAIHLCDSLHALGSLAVLMEDGAPGVVSDPACARDLYECASAQDHLPSMKNLAQMLIDGAPGVESDPPRAVSLLERCIFTKRDVEAMNTLAILLEDGAEGIPVDLERARALYQMAIDEDEYTPAMNNLAVLLEAGGLGSPEDMTRAANLYEWAIRKGGDAHALHNFGLWLLRGSEGVSKDVPRAAELLKRAAEEGSHTNAMVVYAGLLLFGATGVPQDKPYGEELLQRAIGMGEVGVESVYHLAMAFEDGKLGFSVDTLRAMEIYERLLREETHWEAMLKLANLHMATPCTVYTRGERAVGLLTDAMLCPQQDIVAEAKFLLGVLHEEGRSANSDSGIPVAKCPYRAMLLYEEAVSTGNHVPALFRYGRLLNEGAEGVTRNSRKAVDLLQRAITGGSIDARITLASILENGGDGVAQDLKHAAKLYEDTISIESNPQAMYHLAVLRQRNLGHFSGGLADVIHLYERAIWEGSHIDAMEKLARILENGGEDIPADRNRAIVLYKRAALGGCRLAMCQLAHLYDNDVNEKTPNSIELLFAVEWYCRAVQEGCRAEAIVPLALLLTRHSRTLRLDLGKRESARNSKR